ncbi:MAG: hypothetical protein AAGJ79_11270 [Verrucomicrobiota bacterium]
MITREFKEGPTGGRKRADMESKWMVAADWSTLMAKMRRLAVPAGATARTWVKCQMMGALDFGEHREGIRARGRRVVQLTEAH